MRYCSVFRLALLCYRLFDWLEISIARLLDHLALSIFDVFQGCVSCCLSNLWTLTPLRFDYFQWSTDHWLGHCRRLSTSATTLCFFLNSFLVQSTVKLSPTVLRALPPHVKGGLTFRIDEYVGTTVRSNVPSPVARIDPEARKITYFRSVNANSCQSIRHSESGGKITSAHDKNRIVVVGHDKYKLQVRI